MSDSEEELPSHHGNASSYKEGSDNDDDDDEEPSTSWGLKRRKRTIGIISDSDDDDDDDAAEDMAKDDAETCDSDSSGGAPGAETCAICLGRMRGEVGSPDSCDHTFCKFCILEWSKNNPTCPQDRKPFSKIVVRKSLDGPTEKMLPVKKREEEAAFDLALENPTYCEVCNECDREERLLLCDGCDLGYHLECLNPPLSEVPVEEWFCPLCTDLNAPEVLTNRRRSSATCPTQRERRASSSSPSRIHQQSESLRIPRTRATERIRARIQKKKIKNKLKRKQRKERKKAKIESGELEDRRAPVKSLHEFKSFSELDADIDAIHNEDRYAEKLLAGAVVESCHRQSSHRKAAAVRRLREVAFVPQASYSGRAKNRVLEIVNTQSDDNQSDLLSGILENQAIAFSSSKKLVLTNDRKLTKQPGIEIPCKILQEEDPFLPEPLPSQKKTPERSDGLESSPNEKAEEARDGEKSNEDTPVNKSADDYHGATRQQFQSRSTHVHHSERHREWRREYSHGGYSRESSTGSRHGEYERNRYHSRKANDHHRSRYSPYDQHSSSSWNSRSHYKRSEYGRSERHYDRNYSSERRLDSRQNRDYSPGRKKEDMEKESRANRSDKHDKYDDNRSHSSKSRKSHSVSKGKTSHSSVHGENHRSQWSFSYFNTDNLFSKRNNNHSMGSSSNVENPNNVEDVKVSSNEGIKSNPVEVSKDSQSDVAFADSSNINNSSQKTKNNGSHKSISGYSTISTLCEDQESMINVSHIEPEAGSNCVTEIGKEKDDLSQDISHTLKSPDSNLHNSGTDRLYIHSKVNVAESQVKEKSALKSPLGKKNKLAFLFGDTDVNDIKDKSPAKTHENEKDTNRTGREKYKTSDRKAKLKNLFTEDIDDDEHPTISANPERETSLSKIYSNIPIASSDKNMNANVESSHEGGTIHYGKANEEVSGKKNQGKGTHTSKPGKEVSDKHSSRKHTLPTHNKGNDEKHCDPEDNSSKHSKIDSELSKNKQDVLLDNIKDISENECHNKNDSSEKVGKEINEHSIGKRNASHKSSKLSEKCPDKESSSSKHSSETKEKPSHDKKSSSRSQSIKRSECYPTNNVIEAQKKQVSGTAVDKSKLPDVSYSISESLDKKRKIDKECTESDYATKERSKYGQKSKSNKGRAYGVLFGDIEDIDSSSNSNLPEVEVKPIVDNSSSGASKAQLKSAVYDEDYSGKDTLDVVQLSKCLKELSSSQDTTEVNNCKQTNKKDLLSGSHSVSEYKQSCGTKPENDLRIKQQKASLEAKVVQEVKKSLDPYYRNKSITKDEYKEIVAKCVKKVVNAECGDIIEPEKMRSLAVGYIKLFKHRQMKSQT